VTSGSHDCCDGHHEEEEGGHGAHHDDAEEKSLAVRAAMAHVIGDIIASLGVCLSAGLIWAFHDRWLDSDGISYWYRADPICTFLFSFLVLSSTWSTMSEGMHVLMAGAPLNADTPSLLRRLQAIPNVVNVHDLHVWATSSDKINVWAHLTIKSGTDTTAVLYAAQKVAKSIGCHHTCFQLEDQLTYDLRVEGDECYMPGHVHP
jgi:solute carrier family 30 (zinc transporter), member 2